MSGVSHCVYSGGQLDIDDKICVPVDGSDTYLYLDITANDGPSTWG